MAERPRYSVLVPAYNQGQYLPHALDSLLGQEWHDWEAIVVNDGSTDDTAEVADGYARRDSRFVVVHQANGGVAAALNRGLWRATGDWVCWLSSDDWYLPSRLARVDTYLSEHPAARFVHCDWKCFHQQAATFTPSGVSSRVPPAHLQTLTFFQFNYINGITVTVHRSLLDSVGGFNPRLRDAQDFEMWLRMSGVVPFHYLDEPLCVQRVHDLMGSRVDPDRGYYDAALVLLACLRSQPFDSLLRHADLADPAVLEDVVAAALRAAVDRAAAMYRGLGVHATLLSALLEWVDTGVQRVDRAIVREYFGALASAAEAMNHDGAITTMLRSVAEAPAPRLLSEPRTPGGTESTCSASALPFPRDHDSRLLEYLREVDAVAILSDVHRTYSNCWRPSPRPPVVPIDVSKWPSMEELGFWRRTSPQKHHAPVDLDSRGLLIWGAGQAGRRLARQYPFLQATAFVDIDPAKSGTTIDDLPVIDVDAFRAKFMGRARPFVIIASIYHREIASTLIDLGLRPGDDFVAAGLTA